MSEELQNLKKPGGAVVVMLCAIPMLAVLAFGAVDYWAVGILGFLTAVLALIWLGTSWRSGSFDFNRSTLQLPVLGLILIGLIQVAPLADSGVGSDLLNIPASNAISLDPYGTRFFLVRLVILFTFFAAALTFLNNRARLWKVALVLLIFGSVIAFLAILQRLSSTEGIYGFQTAAQAIPFGSYVNQHHFAALLEMLSGIGLGMLFGHGVRRDKKLLVAIAAVVMGMAVIFTGSRGGLIGYLGVAAFALVGNYFFGKVHSGQNFGPESNRARNNLFLIGGGAALLLIVLGTASFFGGGEGLLRGIGIGQSEVDVTSGRGHFWATAIHIFLAHPIVGAGFDAFGVAFTKYDTWHGIMRIEQAHNDYLQILADGGILGFACVVAFIYLFFRKSSSAIAGAHDNLLRSIAIGAAAGCVGIMIHSFFDFPLRTNANAFFFLLIAAMATATFPATHRHRQRSHH